MDQSKKTMRHFYCRDVLWETFEQMANDFDCSIDYLINEAMRYYARSKNYQSSAAQIQVPGGSGSHGPMTPQLMPAAPYGAIVGKQQQSNPQIRRPPPPPGSQPAQKFPSTPPSTPTGPGPGAGGGAGAGAGAVAAAATTNSIGQTPTLYLIYSGNRYPIVKDQFIIGRGCEDVGPGDQGRQHLAQARRRDPAQRDLLHQGPRARPTASTTRACASTTSGSTRATCSTSATTSCASRIAPSELRAGYGAAPASMAAGGAAGLMIAARSARAEASLASLASFMGGTSRLSASKRRPSAA